MEDLVFNSCVPVLHVPLESDGGREGEEHNPRERAAGADLFAVNHAGSARRGRAKRGGRMGETHTTGSRQPPACRAPWDKR